MLTVTDKKVLEKHGFFDPKTSLSKDEMVEELESWKKKLEPKMLESIECSEKKLLQALETFEQKKSREN